MELADARKVRRIAALLSYPSCITHVHLFGVRSSNASATFRAVIAALIKSDVSIL